MTPERWQQIDKLLEQALEQEPVRRNLFLDRACSGDDELRREVETLLAAHDRGGGLLSSPAVVTATQKPADSPQSLFGQSLSHYQILSRLGEGGMGIVYKARDTHLDRFVAIKVLPPELVADPDRKRRFVQEAKAASALNHPNIITIHDIASENGRDFIVMEFIEGKTLDQLIPRRGMKLSDVLKYGIQISDALAKAHAAGIIHRDLKPGNIMVSEGGLVKVLDFGLAKLIGSSQLGQTGETNNVQSQTKQGMVLGTASYMSPEQAAGKPLDARSDIFSFGSVLYEMVTGQRAFEGDSTISTLSAVLREDPKPAGQIVSGIPPELERVVQRCLRKDPERRFQHLDDVKVFLEEALEKAGSEKPQEGDGVAAHKTRRRVLIGGLLAGMTALALAVGLWRTFRQSDLPPMTLVPLTTYPGHERFPTFSPDGNQVAFSWDGEKRDNLDIYIKLIGTEPPMRLTHHPAEDYGPAWSPDGRWIAFLRKVGEGKAAVMLVPPIIGGGERMVIEVATPWNPLMATPLTWSPNGNSLIVSDMETDNEPFGLYSVFLESGEKRRLTTPPSAAKAGGNKSPVFSPDGRAIAFVQTLGYATGDLYVMPLNDPMNAVSQATKLVAGRWLVMNMVWTPDGREIIFSSSENQGYSGLWRVAASGSGEPEQLTVGENGQDPTVSTQKHRLAYSQVISDTNIWRVDISGRPARAPTMEPLITSTRRETNPQFSPDGKRIVFSSNRSGVSEIWVCNSDGSAPMQLTSFGRRATASPRWSPDDRWVCFDSNADGQFEVYVVDANGGRPRRLTSNLALDAAPSWSWDGKWIYFVSTRNGNEQVWKMPWMGGEAIQLTQKGGFAALESLDGKFVYYTKAANDTSLWRVPAQGGEEVQVLDPIVFRNFSVTKDGVYFVFQPDSKGHYVIRLLKTSTGEIQTIASIENPVRNGLSVSPDGRWILYPKLDQEGSDLMLVENFR
jgi:eukaryotic-like serine/threonine-protein kinase